MVKIVIIILSWILISCDYKVESTKSEENKNIGNTDKNESTNSINGCKQYDSNKDFLTYVQKERKCSQNEVIILDSMLESSGYNFYELVVFTEQENINISFDEELTLMIVYIDSDTSFSRYEYSNFKLLEIFTSEIFEIASSSETNSIIQTIIEFTVMNESSRVDFHKVKYDNNRYTLKSIDSEVPNKQNELFKKRFCTELYKSLFSDYLIINE